MRVIWIRPTANVSRVPLYGHCTTNTFEKILTKQEKLFMCVFANQSTTNEQHSFPVKHLLLLLLPPFQGPEAFSEIRQ